MDKYPKRIIASFHDFKALLHKSGAVTIDGVRFGPGEVISGLARNLDRLDETKGKYTEVNTGERTASK